MTAGPTGAITEFRHLPHGHITEVGDAAAQDWIRPSSRAWRIA